MISTTPRMGPESFAIGFSALRGAKVTSFVSFENPKRFSQKEPAWTSWVVDLPFRAL
jgi:hypothetical protein